MSIQRIIKKSSQSTEPGNNCCASSWTLMEEKDEILFIEEEAKGRKVNIRVSGNLRSDTARYFEDELLALATVDADVTLELDALQSISNSAQKALIKTQQMMDRLKRGTLTLTKLPNEIAENFQKSGISDALMIE